MAAPTIHIEEATPTVFLRRAGGRLEQLVRVVVCNDGAAIPAVITADAGRRATTVRAELPAGQSTHEIYVGAEAAFAEAIFAVQAQGTTGDTRRVPWTPPRRWTVHVVQRSHHDVGYTDLASHVLLEHAEMLDRAVDFAAATRDYPEDSRFRMVAEQTWSVDYYLRHARPDRAALMLELLRRGDIELTALFGNQVTELCGHETLARSVYHAFRLKRLHGIPIMSAEHNDIPGFTWGLCQVLTAAGVRFFCPGLPLYYNWGHADAVSFWDEAAVFGSKGMPGAFWWQAPDGSRLLVWCNPGFGSEHHASFPGLPEELKRLEAGGYPYSVLRMPASGGQRDNQPYTDLFAHSIKAWNERWAYPRLVSSTNARFYADLLPHLPASLRVHRGDVPGQDYPVGATSTAAATAVNRRNHADLPAAEALATMAGVLTGATCPSDRVFQAYEEILWHDEHTWGHHFPCGPTANAAELEKAVHAHRAAALAHDVANKAMARVADAVRLDADDFHLVVFNALPYERSAIARSPMREIDNCGSTMVWRDDPQGGTLRGVLLGNRWHENLPPELLEGRFDLLDAETGEAVPYQLVELDSPYAPVPYAAQRAGLGAGGKRYGFFERPVGIARDLCFRAVRVPALGYRAYRLRPRADRPVFAAGVRAAENVLENDFYRIEVNPRTGFVTGIRDKEAERDLLAPDAPHPFGELVVRDPGGEVSGSTFVSLRPGERGPLYASLRIVRSAPGHPHIEQTIALHAGVKRIEFAVGLLKDPTPLLDSSLAFPFRVPGGRVYHEGPFSVVEAGANLFPGAFADRLTVQNGVELREEAWSLAWSSLDAPIVSLGQLWPGRFSPAHSCRVRDDVEHAPPGVEQLRGGTIYSCLTHNNCGTNFAVSQSGPLLFRYAFTTGPGAGTDAAARFGEECAVPLQTMLTKAAGPRPLPPAQGCLAIDNPVVHLIALKRAEDSRGVVLRLWNAGPAPAQATVTWPRRTLRKVNYTTLAEEDIPEKPACTEHAIAVAMAPWAIATLRIVDG